MLSFDEKVEKSKTVIKEAFVLYGSESLAIAITEGKDSTANLWLFKQVCEEDGFKLRVVGFEGQKLVRRVYSKQEIFTGKYIDDAPDLYILAEPGFDLKAALNKEIVFGLSHFRGAHTYSDAHLFISEQEQLEATADLSIEAVPQIIKSYFS